MNIALFLVTILIICLYSAVDVLISGKKLIIRNLAIGTALYFAAFMIISLCAFVLGIYSVVYVYIVISVIALIALLCLYLLKYMKQKTLKSIKATRYFPISLIVILIVGVLFTFQKSELQGMGGDQGNYQINTLLMLDGLESNVVEVKEYELLTNDEDRQLFIDILNREKLSNLGFYSMSVNDNKGTIQAGSNPVNSAILHGLPNFPAILSVFGMIFGVENFMHGLTIPYIIAIILVYLTLNINLGLGKSASIISTLIYSLSPIVLWAAKSAFTEIYTSMFIALFLFYLTEKEQNHSWLLWIPVAAFAFFHVSIYTVMPMFVLLFVWLTLYKKDTGAWFSGLLSIIFYALGYIIMCYVAPKYTFMNYMPLFSAINRLGFHFTEDSSQFIFVFPICFIAILLFVLIWRLIIKKHWIPREIKTVLPTVFLILTAICIAAIAYRWNSAARELPRHITAHTQFLGAGLINTIPNLRIFATALWSGFALITIILLDVIRRKKNLYTKEIFPLTFVCFYAVLFVSSFLHVTFPFHYYFSRYIVPFFPVLIILGAVCVSRYRVAVKSMVALVSICVILPFSAVLALNKDNSLMEIRTQREIIDTVSEFEPGSLIIIDDNLKNFLLHSISYSTDSFAFPSSLFIQLQDISFIGDHNVYSIIGDYNKAELVGYDSVDTIVLRTSVMDAWVTGWNPGPRSLLRPRKSSYLVKIGQPGYFDNDVISIEMNQSYSFFVYSANTFESHENEYWLWSCSETMFSFWLLAENDYKFCIYLHSPPFPSAVDELLIEFKLANNDDILYSCVVDADTACIEFVVPKEKLHAGMHTLIMFSETWSPTEVFGSSDTRELGVCIKSVEAIPFGVNE